VDEELSASLQPDPWDGERAEVTIEDFSLRLDNPFAGSSLVPAAQQERSFQWLVAVVGVAAGGVLTALLIALRASLLPATDAPERRVLEQAPAAQVSTAALTLAPEDVPQAPSQSSASITQPPAAVKAVAAGTELAAPSVPAPRATSTDVATGERSPPPTSEQSSAVVAPAAVSVATPEPAAEAPDEALPLTPTRADIAAGLEALRPALVHCAEGQSGLLTIDATIAASGRVTHALIQGDFQGTPTGSCMARAVRQATFPPFRQPKLTVRYPLAL
jgi:hypothetical protein